MEVHHPSHFRHKPKQWKEYFLEFLMIFLAVTMGFFAENIREHIINSKKEKHYIQSLAEDIKKDTAQLISYIRFKVSVLHYCDSLQFAISHEDVFTKTNVLYTYGRELTRYMRYYPADRTFEQLKNAGNIQLISDWNTSNAISEYYSQTKFMEEADQELNEEILRYRRYLIEFLDLTSYDQLNKRGSFLDIAQIKGNPALLNYESNKVKVIYNEIFTLEAFLKSDYYHASTLLNSANNLLALLHKEYNF